jgi:hypothetical protein
MVFSVLTPVIAGDLPSIIDIHSDFSLFGYNQIAAGVLRFRGRACGTAPSLPRGLIPWQICPPIRKSRAPTGVTINSRISRTWKRERPLLSGSAGGTGITHAFAFRYLYGERPAGTPALAGGGAPARTCTSKAANAPQSSTSPAPIPVILACIVFCRLPDLGIPRLTRGESGLAESFARSHWKVMDQI